MYQRRRTFITNARNELYAFCVGKGDLLKYILRPIGGGLSPFKSTTVIVQSQSNPNTVHVPIAAFIFSLPFPVISHRFRRCSRILIFFRSTDDSVSVN